MPIKPFCALALVLAATAFAPLAQAQSCEGGGYMNPQLFRGDAATSNAIAEQEMLNFAARAGLPSGPLYPVKRVDDITANGRAPHCWNYVNLVTGLLSGNRLVVVNKEPVHPAVLAITQVVPGLPVDSKAVPLASLSAAEQKAVLDQLSRSKCFGTTAGVEAAVVKAEGLCGQVEDVAPQLAVGQQGLIAKAAFAWEEQAWAGITTRESAALNTTMKGLAGRSEKVHNARLVVVPTKATAVGFGLFVHPSVPDAVVKKAATAFQGLTSPSRSLAVALDLGPQFAFVAPSADELGRMRAAIGMPR